jgi:hypothetical protein
MAILAKLLFQSSIGDKAIKLRTLPCYVGAAVLGVELSSNGNLRPLLTLAVKECTRNKVHCLFTKLIVLL